MQITTFDDIVRALRERPEWRDEMRRLIFTDELLLLPQKFEHFVEKEFKPLAAHVDKLTVDMYVLKEDAKVLKYKTTGLEKDVAVLRQDVEILKQNVAVLKQDVEDSNITLLPLRKMLKKLRRDWQA